MLSGSMYDGVAGRAFVFSPGPLQGVNEPSYMMRVIHTLVSSHGQALRLRKSRSWHRWCGWDEVDLHAIRMPAVG